jgi:hypothetical protein
MLAQGLGLLSQGRERVLYRFFGNVSIATPTKGRRSKHADIPCDQALEGLFIPPLYEANETVVVW